ncbi:hydroxymethyldihydropterin pyrophosphokinase-dihydropteroate synthase, putative [Eimeria praecox]|uniref:Hydroxymethyldihydropterin pyrophosphokinase-dihydropteroate synthase, putative n=1 Tax=Eimeria praecox TaxID=51316 RepID=U6H616_9EIME|nr:hydroxymethyldihydropterin pyrophosphokinase-dihydropteroate synthase, putative [Eimeria praecox]
MSAVQKREAHSLAYISLGTNFGGNLRLSIIESALSSIQNEVGSIDACSCLYESLPGFDVDPRPKDQHDLSLPLHLNAVVRVQTEIEDPEVVLEKLHSIEQQHGRDRSPSAVRLHRALDLDLLFFVDSELNNRQIHSDKLILPHPRLYQRNFVLFPLCDIQPTLKHPAIEKTIKELIQENLKRREEVLIQSTSSLSNNLSPLSDPYTIDGNLAVPRRCFAANDGQLWTIKGGSEFAVEDTLLWIQQVLNRYGLKEEKEAEDISLQECKERLLQLKHFLLQEPISPRLMGILNVTPDSFSDGLKFYDNVEAAVKQAQSLIQGGAAIIDVGGEATNPFVQEEVSVHTEIERVKPVIEALRKEIQKNILISVDTRRKPVAEAAIAAGADVINDVSGGEADPSLLVFAAEQRKYPLVIMHSRGTPKTMDSLAKYDDVVNEVAEFLTEKTNTLIKLGLPRWRLILDVGLGFAKKAEHSFELLRRLPELRSKLPSGLPILLGHSRKRFIGWAIEERQKKLQVQQKGEDCERKTTTKEEDMNSRDIAGLAVACWASSNINTCVDILRVHDVKKTDLACAVMEQLIKSNQQNTQSPVAVLKAMYPSLEG